MSHNRKKKSGSRTKTPQERIAYDELEKTAPGAGSTAPQETGEKGSLSDDIATEDVPQRERHRVLTPDELYRTRETSWKFFLGIAIPIILALIGLAYWAGKLQMRVDTNDSSINKIETNVSDIEKQVNELRIAMVKLEADNLLGKNIQTDYQQTKTALAELQKTVNNIDTINKKHADEIRQLIARIEGLNKESINGIK